MTTSDAGNQGTNKVKLPSGPDALTRRPVEELNVNNSPSCKGCGMCGVQDHERREKGNNKITSLTE